MIYFIELLNMSTSKYFNTKGVKETGGSGGGGANSSRVYVLENRVKDLTAELDQLTTQIHKLQATVSSISNSVEGKLSGVSEYLPKFDKSSGYTAGYTNMLAVYPQMTGSKIETLPPKEQPTYPIYISPYVSQAQTSSSYNMPNPVVGCDFYVSSYPKAYVDNISVDTIPFMTVKELDELDKNNVYMRTKPTGITGQVYSKSSTDDGKYIVNKGDDIQFNNHGVLLRNVPIYTTNEAKKDDRYSTSAFETNISVLKSVNKNYVNVPDEDKPNIKLDEQHKSYVVSMVKTAKRPEHGDLVNPDMSPAYNILTETTTDKPEFNETYTELKDMVISSNSDKTKTTDTTTSTKLNTKQLTINNDETANTTTTTTESSVSTTHETKTTSSEALLNNDQLSLATNITENTKLNDDTKDSKTKKTKSSTLLNNAKLDISTEEEEEKELNNDTAKSKTTKTTKSALLNNKTLDMTTNITDNTKLNDDTENDKSTKTETLLNDVELDISTKKTDMIYANLKAVKSKSTKTETLLNNAKLDISTEEDEGEELSDDDTTIKSKSKAKSTKTETLLDNDILTISTNKTDKTETIKINDDTTETTTQNIKTDSKNTSLNNVALAINNDNKDEVITTKDKSTTTKIITQAKTDLSLSNEGLDAETYDLKPGTTQVIRTVNITYYAVEEEKDANEGASGGSAAATKDPEKCNKETITTYTNYKIVPDKDDEAVKTKEQTSQSIIKTYEEVDNPWHGQDPPMVFPHAEEEEKYTEEEQEVDIVNDKKIKFDSSEASIVNTSNYQTEQAVIKPNEITLNQVQITDKDNNNNKLYNGLQISQKLEPKIPAIPEVPATETTPAIPAVPEVPATQAIVFSSLENSNDTNWKQDGKISIYKDTENDNKYVRVDNNLYTGQIQATGDITTKLNVIGSNIKADNDLRLREMKQQMETISQAIVTSWVIENTSFSIADDIKGYKWNDFIVEQSGDILIGSSKVKRTIKYGTFSAFDNAVMYSYGTGARISDSTTTYYLFFDENNIVAVGTASSGPIKWTYKHITPDNYIKKKWIDAIDNGGRIIAAISENTTKTDSEGNVEVVKALTFKNNLNEWSDIDLTPSLDGGVDGEACTGISYGTINTFIITTNTSKLIRVDLFGNTKIINIPDDISSTWDTRCATQYKNRFIALMNDSNVCYYTDDLTDTPTFKTSELPASKPWSGIQSSNDGNMYVVVHENTALTDNSYIVYAYDDLIWYKKELDKPINFKKLKFAKKASDGWYHWKALGDINDVITSIKIFPSSWRTQKIPSTVVIGGTDYTVGAISSIAKRYDDDHIVRIAYGNLIFTFTKSDNKWTYDCMNVKVEGYGGTIIPYQSSINAFEILGSNHVAFCSNNGECLYINLNGVVYTYPIPTEETGDTIPFSGLFDIIKFYNDLIIVSSYVYYYHAGNSYLVRIVGAETYNKGATMCRSYLDSSSVQLILTNETSCCYIIGSNTTAPSVKKTGPIGAESGCTYGKSTTISGYFVISFATNKSSLAIGAITSDISSHIVDVGDGSSTIVTTENETMTWSNIRTYSDEDKTGWIDMTYSDNKITILNTDPGVVAEGLFSIVNLPNQVISKDTAYDETEKKEKTRTYVGIVFESIMHDDAARVYKYRLYKKYVTIESTASSSIGKYDNTTIIDAEQLRTIEITWEDRATDIKGTTNLTGAALCSVSSSLIVFQNDKYSYNNNGWNVEDIQVVYGSAVVPGNITDSYQLVKHESVGGRMAALDKNGSFVLTSSDSKSWTVERPITTKADWKYLCSCDDKKSILAVGAVFNNDFTKIHPGVKYSVETGSCSIIESVDGEMWTVVANAGGLYIALGKAASVNANTFTYTTTNETKAKYSTDGVKWFDIVFKNDEGGTDSYKLPDGKEWCGIACGMTYIVCIASNDSSSYSIQYGKDESNNLVFKKPIVSNIGITPCGITYASGYFEVINSSSSNMIYYSSDYGQTWVSSEVSKTDSRNWKCITNNGQQFISFAYGDNHYSRSIDGKIWAQMEIPNASSNYNWISATHGANIGYSALTENFNNVCLGTESIGSLDSFSVLIKEQCFPVNSLYMTMDSANPELVLGFGKWTQITSSFLRCADAGGSSGLTGGASSVTHKHTTAGHTLSISEMPSHRHYTSFGFNRMPIGGGSDPESLQQPNYRQEFVGGYYTDYIGGGNSHSHGDTGTTEISIIPPYITIYVWQRTK